MIGIVDDGVDWTHEDLNTNYEDSLDYDYCNNDDDPYPMERYHEHGTAVAGVAVL